MSGGYAWAFLKNPGSIVGGFPSFDGTTWSWSSESAAIQPDITGDGWPVGSEVVPRPA